MLGIFAATSVLALLVAIGLLAGAQTATPTPSDDVDARAESLLRMGELYMVTPNPFEALEYFREALALVPDNADFYLRAARSYPDARSQLFYLNSGLDRLPDDGLLHLAVGHSLYSIYAEPWQFERQSEFERPEDVLDAAMQKYAVAQALRSDPKLQAIPIVAVTSYAMAGDRERCLAAGCNGYIEKPIDPQTFAEEVERFIKGVA